MIKSTMSYDRLAMEPPGALSQEGYARGPDIEALRSRIAEAKKIVDTAKTALDASKLAKDRLGAYLVLGVLASFTFQVLYNITMSAGLAPVKGLTLPLMSYGGSSMIATLAGFGLILNVRMRRFTN